MFDAYSPPLEILLQNNSVLQANEMEKKKMKKRKIMRSNLGSKREKTAMRLSTRGFTFGIISIFTFSVKMKSAHIEMIYVEIFTRFKINPAMV